MCRFVSYLGRPIIIDELLLKPENSLVNQSYDAEEMSQPLNGDGFGLGWYAREIRSQPGLFRSITPAWNNQNLRYNASLIRTPCLFAHIRAASVGVVSEANCHPFHYHDYLLMHNGGIDDFRHIKRDLVRLLNDEFFLWVTGQTDSEHIFAFFLQTLVERYGEELPQPEQVAACFQHTFDMMEVLKRHRNIAGNSTYNMLVTDGRRIFGTRYNSSPHEASPTLYYATGSRFESHPNGDCFIRDNKEGRQFVMVVSEKLNEREEDWTVVPPNHFIWVGEDLEVKLMAMGSRIQSGRVKPGLC